MNEEQILCASSAYEQKFYLNPRFATLPTQIKQELQIIAVSLTAEFGGVFTMEFDETGTLYLSTTARENDFSYDEIGIHLKIKEIQDNYKDLLEKLEEYYRSFFTL